MNRTYTALAAVALIVCSAPLAHAAPPTVTPSPGYDARLQEQRKANSAPSSTVYRPAPPPVAPVPRHHARRKR